MRARTSKSGDTGSFPRPKAYQEVAATLRDRIDEGVLSYGERLPNELDLAEEFGVSRATIREALRLISAYDLIRTAKGSGGGSYVSVPRLEHVTDFVQTSINLMSVAEHISLDQLLEARAALEVPAARLAASRRRIQDVERMRATIGPPPGADPRTNHANHRDFHSVTLESCGNPLLNIAAKPIFGVLMTNVDRSKFTAKFDRAIREQHATIADAVEAGDVDRAGRLMEEHLAFLKPEYERTWLRGTAK